MLFDQLSGQPLVTVGGTGPMLIFEEYLYKVKLKMGPTFRVRVELG